ncbi:hypothetical protein KR215_005881 [Drosophila sulfurigaster]|nr:hypothetical protein KR215_005881 [Drosophila sulfurigaster]
MDIKKEFEKIWEFLMKPDENLHIPLLYVIAPLSIIALILFCCCCYFCVKACQDDPDAYIVVNPSRQPNSVQRHDRVQTRRQSTEAGPSAELQGNAAQNIHAMYKKRNYKVPQ